MIALNSSPVSQDVACAAMENVQSTSIYSASKINIEKPIDAVLNQKYFVCGDIMLSFEKYPTISYYQIQNEIEVKGWNIRLPIERCDDLGREIIRKYLFLYNKAGHNQLDNIEKAEWAEIVQQVDYKKFCIDRSPWVYGEGKLLDKTSDGFHVEWQDGSKERFSLAIGGSLDILNIGEWFQVFVKYGKDNKVIALDQLLPIQHISQINGDDIWQSWPTNRS